MLTKTKMVLAALLVLGTASAALAGSDRDDATGSGYALPGSMSGVNPVDHPRIFGNRAAAEAYGFVPTHAHRTHKAR